MSAKTKRNPQSCQLKSNEGERWNDLVVLHLNIHNETEKAGWLLKKHNLFMYKAPGKSLTITDYYKAVSDCCIYKAEHLDEADSIKAEDMTLSLVHNEKPVDLFRDLVNDGIHISNRFPGIYYLSGHVLFTTQVICTRELSQKDFIWLKSLDTNLDINQAKALVEATDQLPKHSREREVANEVLQVAMNANQETFEELKKDSIMDEVLRRLIEPG